jgi:hypothetical protein
MSHLRGMTMTKQIPLLTIVALAAASAFIPHTAHAALFTIDCGASGPTTALQAQVSSLGSTPNNQINVLGTCVGDLDVSRSDRLTISNLSLTGSISSTAANTLRLTNLTLNGGLTILATRNSSVGTATIRGDIYIQRGSQISFVTLTLNPYTDSTGTHDPTFSCAGQSECTLSNSLLTGTGTSTTSVGALAASGSRLNFYSGTITGFGIGLMSWNNAIAFVMPICDPLAIRGNKEMGVSVSDSGMVRMAGMSTADLVANGCPGTTPVPVDISANGKYGVFADGGGNAYLQLTRITGHTLDGVRVQNGSIMRVRNSTIDAAVTSRRSARVKGAAHLFFDEQEAGPTARSTLSGPVCVTTSGTTETENSATSLTITRICSGP